MSAQPNRTLSPFSDNMSEDRLALLARLTGKLSEPLRKVWPHLSFKMAFKQQPQHQPCRGKSQSNRPAGKHKQAQA